MKRILSLLLAFLVSGSFVFGQLNLFGPGSLKLIEKGKFVEAEKKINKDLQKTPDDIETNYAMALLLLNRNYTSYNTEKSYEYLMKCIKLFENTREERELKKLSKIPVTRVILQNYTDTISRLAMEDAVAKNNVDIYQKYLDFYLTAPLSYQKTITENRDATAYATACNKNTVESYEHFISKYPDAVQHAEAIQKRNITAFQKARTADHIDAYKDFVIRYPSANEVTLAWDRIHQLAFGEAEKENTSASFKKFMNDYPYSKQYSQALTAYEKRQYIENVTVGDWNDYRAFIEQFPNNQWKLVALDSIYSIAVRSENLEILSYCLDNFSGEKRKNALLLYHDIFTMDGEKLTLDMFNEKYEDDLLNDVKAKDYEIAILGDDLMLQMPYKSSNFSKYDEYIRKAAPRDKAFTALQKLISPELESKNYQAAIAKIESYLPFFGKRNKKLLDLISFLETK